MSINTLEKKLCDIISETDGRENNYTCHLCERNKKVKNVNINVLGPDGTKICEECEVKVADFMLKLSLEGKSVTHIER